ncbi:phosphatidylethanolamine-binding protein [Lasiosphaeria hispida]|uniref:Phosphatidylethanolamine-binding protein n=1 Tax=Lasiosphaeria hispida TaxID=260671 RepID=A0AAJ0MD80_9PEZI|nr:phosphatidylethanolamine-binding protein [Lasiosphaeria hispida]
MPKPAASIQQTLSSLASLSPGYAAPKAPLRIHFPSTTVTQPGEHLTKAASASEPSFSVAATALNNLSFPNRDLSPTTNASSATDPPSPGTPELSTAAAPRYLIAGLDLDPPFPTFPVMGPALHMLRADLALATGEVNPDDEFIRLEDGEEGSVVGRRPVAYYLGPSPPPVGGPHRYVFMLWEQPEGVTGERIKEEMGYDEGGVGMMGRVRWDQEGFEKKLGLGKVVAGNYFVC